MALAPVDSQLKIEITDEVHQVLTPSAEVVGDLPDLSASRMLQFYRWMVLGRTFSNRMVAMQRQGRMGTFAPLNGQEAASVGLAGPLKKEDWLVASYRENISYLVKGVPLLAIMKQWGGYITQEYARKLNCPPFQVVLGTQTLHAVGVAQAIKYNKSQQVVVTACGDGATSEGDFNEALNFAGVFKVPIVFVVQNNGWAISTPRQRQSAARYFADRGPAFGIPGYVVDGNELLAVYHLVAHAVDRARAGQGPTLVETLTYRMGAHTTADDPTRYRSAGEVEAWSDRDPITRFRKFLMDRELLSRAEDEALYQEVAAEIEEAVAAYEAIAAPSPAQQFEFVYGDKSPQLRRQQADWLQDLDMALEDGAGVSQK